jgi:hypothetical protein
LFIKLALRNVEANDYYQRRIVQPGKYREKERRIIEHRTFRKEKNRPAWRLYNQKRRKRQKGGIW